MIGHGGARVGAKSESSDNAGMALVGLFPAPDSDEEQDYVGSNPATPAETKRGAAQQDWSLFPEREDSLAQPAAASAKGGYKY